MLDKKINDTTPKVKHICNSHLLTLKPKIAKELALPTLKEENNETPTRAIRNLGNVLILRLLALNKISSKLKINRFKIPNYA